MAKKKKQKEEPLNPATATLDQLLAARDRATGYTTGPAPDYRNMSLDQLLEASRIAQEAADNPKASDSYRKLLAKVPDSADYESRLAAGEQHKDEDNSFFESVVNKIPGKGAVSRVFDLLSRGNYAMAEGSERLLEGRKPGKEGPIGQVINSPLEMLATPFKDLGKLAGLGDEERKTDDLLSGLWAGFSGKEKTSFGDVMREQGAKKNFGRGLAGFGMDVLFDPINLTGAGVVGKASKIGDASKAVKVGEVYKDAAKAKRAGEISGRITKSDLNKSAAKLTDEAALRQADKLSKIQTAAKSREDLRNATIAGDDVAMSEAVTNLANAKAATEPKFAFKFAGTPIVESKTAYKAGKITKDALTFKSNGELRAIPKMFSREAWVGGAEMNSITRRAESAAEGRFAEKAKALDKTLGSLTNDELEQITKARINGTLVGDEALANGPITVTVPQIDGAALILKATSLQDMQDLFAREMDNMHAAEVAAGIQAPGSYRPNYVPKVPFKPMDEVERRTYKGLDPIQAMQSSNVKFNLNAKDILQVRMSEHAREMARFDVYSTVADAFGATVDDSLHKATLRNSGWKSIDELEIKDSHKIDFKKAVNPEGFYKTKSVRGRPVKQMSGQGSLLDGLELDDLGGVSKGVKGAEEVLLPPEVAQGISNYVKVIADPTEAGHFMEFMQKAIGPWKFWATSANPGYHTRNSLTDGLSNYSAGVRTLSPYQRAGKVLREANRLAQEDLLKTVDSAIPRNPKTVTVGGEKASSRMLNEALIEGGGRPGFTSVEIGVRGLDEEKGRIRQVIDQNPGLKAAADFKDKARVKINDWSDMRETYFRMAHLIDYLDKNGRSIEIWNNGLLTEKGKKLIDEAGDQIRKYNLDYGSKTPFERGLTKAAIPFYTYQRRMLPLQMQLLFTQPGIQAMYPKLIRDAQDLLGTSEGEDELLPEWIRNSAPLRLQTHKQIQKGPVGQLLKVFGVKPGEQASINTNQLTPLGSVLPLLDPLGTAQGGNDLTARYGREIAGRLNPLAKAPIELAKGERIDTQAKINPNPFVYAANQAPISRAVVGHTGLGGEDTPGSEWSKLVFGLPVQKATERTMQGEFRRREDILNQHMSYLRTKLLTEQEQQAFGATKQNQIVRQRYGQ